jgi:two-component system LytT family sensor kinase
MAKSSKKIIIVLLHIVAWASFFLLPYIFSPQPKDIPEQVSKYILTLYIVINLYLLIFYYFNTLLLIPKLLFKKRWIIYLIIVGICMYGFTNVPRQISLWLNNTTESKIRSEFRPDFRRIDTANYLKNDTSNNAELRKPFPPQMRPDNMNKRRNNRYFPGREAIFLLVLAVGLSISLLQQWLKVEKTKEEIEKEMLRTELSFLKTQINPHFFFNTLNNIYSLAITGSDKTASAILKLSAIMRYILTETKYDWVPIQSEIDFLNDYIELQKVRLTDNVALNVNIIGNITNQKVAPLLFIPFVENAFKYGVSTVENSFIHINLNIKENSIVFSVENSIAANAGNTLTETTGIGIKNVERRLALLYPDMHKLTIEKEKNTFRVTLTLLKMV